MNSRKSRVMIWTLIITPIPLALCLLFGGPYGGYFLFKLFYPYSMLIASQADYITKVAQWLGLLQFPVYGLILVMLEKHVKLYKAMLVIVGVHLACFVIALKYVEGF